MKWTRWTKQEIKILHKHFEWTPWSELLLMLPGRSPQYIRNLGRKFELIRKVEQVHSEATREKIGEAMIGKPSRFAGHNHTTETKLRIRVKNLYVRGNSMTDIANRTGKTEEEICEIFETS